MTASIQHSSQSVKLVSIVIPLYNSSQYVGETLNSLLSQTYQNIEIIIVDDGSLDNSVEVCRQFQDARIKIIQQENRGLPGARNTGIRHATGDYIGFLDADDLWMPNKVEQHVLHLELVPKVGVSFSYSAFIDGKGERTGIFQIPSKINELTPGYVLCRNPVGNGSSAILRREAFDSIAFTDNLHGLEELCYFDERLRFHKADATDLECWTRIATHTKWELEGIPEALTLYRVNSEGLSANALQQLEAIEAVIEKSCNSAPKILNPYRNLARAYYMRYVARRAITLRDSRLAVRMINKSLLTDWSIAWKEPQRTLITFCASYILQLVPSFLYQPVEQFALKIVGFFQISKLSRTLPS